MRMMRIHTMQGRQQPFVIDRKSFKDYLWRMWLDYSACNTRLTDSEKSAKKKQRVCFLFLFLFHISKPTCSMQYQQGILLSIFLSSVHCDFSTASLLSICFLPCLFIQCVASEVTLDTSRSFTITIPRTNNDHDCNYCFRDNIIIHNRTVRIVTNVMKIIIYYDVKYLLEFLYLLS